jgi:hypothetical protein
MCGSEQERWQLKGENVFALTICEKMETEQYTGPVVKLK